jgi:hypothetical protein
MIADFGLLLRALGEQRLYRRFRHRGGGETLSSRAAIRSLTRPFAVRLRASQLTAAGAQGC